VSGPALVTGASGFLGRPLVAALLAAGRPVTALCRRPDDLAFLASAGRLRIVQGDLRDPSAWKPLLAPGLAVFHLAAARSLPGVTARELEEVNVGATLALARAAAEAGVARYVHVATALIYGPASEGRPRTEEDELQDRPGEASHFSTYVRTRAAAVRAVRELARAGLRAVTVCPAVIYGPDAPGHPNRVTSEIRRLLRTRAEVRIGGGEALRDLVHVDDVVRGLLLAEERAAPGDELILGGEAASPREFARQVFGAAGARRRAALPVAAGLALAAARLADRLGGHDPGCGRTAAVRTLLLPWRFSSERARQRLGYRSTPLAEGLARTVRWVLSTGDEMGRMDSVEGRAA
jgi:nucleoside-diphosphate-sugar epimerase